jgi:Ca2+-binding EF-hand superfamily protein
VFANAEFSSVVCFKVFDEDQDGRLDSDELHHMANVLLLVRAESCATPDYTSLGEISTIVYDAQVLI